MWRKRWCSTHITDIISPDGDLLDCLRVASHPWPLPLETGWICNVSSLCTVPLTLSLLSAFSRRTRSSPECLSVMKRGEWACGGLAKHQTIKKAFLKIKIIVKTNESRLREIVTNSYSYPSYKTKHSYLLIQGQCYMWSKTRCGLGSWQWQWFNVG